MGWATGVPFPRGARITSLHHTFKPALEVIQSATQWVVGSIYLEVKRPGFESDHSPACSGEVNDAWSYTSTPPYVFIAWCLIMHKKQLHLHLSLAFLKRN
jgi:hypothetical protein